MRFPLTRELIDEAARFNLRSACCHCFYGMADGSCALQWPNDDQARWPLEGPDADFCKEFELR